MGGAEERIFHIAHSTDWVAAQAAGEYRTPSLAAQGFIHCSTRSQVIRVADALFRGQTGLLLLAIDPARLRAALRYEPPINPHTGQSEPDIHELFPHVYGPLNLDAVTQTAPLLPGADGRFALPDIE